MKAGIITFHNADNYGAVLQVYALQKAIQHLNTDCEIIDYRCPFIESRHALFNKDVLSSPVRLLKKTINFPFLFRKRKEFKRFREKYLKRGNSVILGHDGLSGLNSEYDMVISGSDQVWNEELSLEAKTYMLDWVTRPVKKVAYAASFGYSLIPDKHSGQIEDYRALLSDFDQISVREAQAAQIVKELTGKEVPIVLDPTLLILQDEWNKITEETNTDKEYILVYNAENPRPLFSFAEELSRMSGLPVKYIGDSIVKRTKAEYIRGCSPTKFLSLLKNARYIVTNSFHAVAFSIIFNRDFFLDFLSPLNPFNSRLESILNIFGLEERLISNINDNNMFKATDYNNVNAKLEYLRKDSLLFLTKLLESMDE